MEIYTTLNKNPELSLALGFFDGVHLGHREVIKNAVNFARKNNTKSAVITFKDHPCCHFYGVAPKYILQRKSRIEKIAELGVDFLYMLDFDDYLSKLSAQDYLKDILEKCFCPKAISTGFNHNFGAHKSGNVFYLREMSAKYNYEYFEIPPQKYNNEIISSTAIRECLSRGETAKAKAMLGYNFFIEGEVIKGEQLGRKIGFKTANLIYPDEMIDLPYGVYRTEVTLSNEKFTAITNFGKRPTVSNKNNLSLETHILNYNRNIYGENLKIEFIKMLRKEQKFASVDELKQQIQQDIKQISSF